MNVITLGDMLEETSNAKKIIEARQKEIERAYSCHCERDLDKLSEYHNNKEDFIVNSDKWFCILGKCKNIEKLSVHIPQLNKLIDKEYKHPFITYPIYDDEDIDEDYVRTIFYVFGGLYKNLVYNNCYSRETRYLLNLVISDFALSNFSYFQYRKEDLVELYTYMKFFVDGKKYNTINDDLIKDYHINYEDFIHSLTIVKEHIVDLVLKEESTIVREIFNEK